MRAVKYFIRDYEQSTGQRLVGFRRHVNSFIAGGGNAPSAQKPYTPQEAQAAQDIIDGLKHYAKTFNPNNETQNTELQKLKLLLFLPHATGLPMQVVGKYGIQTKFDSWEDVKQFILEHKNFCLDPERKQEFAKVLTNDTCSPDAKVLIESIVNTFDQLPTSIHQPQDSATDESGESDDEGSLNTLSPEGHSTPLSYSDDEDDMEEHPSSTNHNEVANEILGAIRKKVYTQAERKEQLKEFIRKVQGIMKFYTMFALLPIRQQQQKRQQIEQAKEQLIGHFQKWVSDTIHKSITPDMALSILARLVQIARNKQE